MKLKELKTFNTPTDIIIFGSGYGEDYNCDFSITDDYTSFYLTNNGKKLTCLDSDGFGTILTVTDFMNVEFENGLDLKSGGSDFYIIKNFTGVAKLVVKWEGKEYDTDKIKSDEYICYDCGLDDDEDFWPDVYVDLISEQTYTEIKLTQEIYNNLLINHQRKEKLENLK